MKLNFVFAVFVFCFLMLQAHDIPVADFIFSQKGSTLQLDITLEKADFEQAYTHKGQEICTEQEDKENLMKDYLRSHLTVKVNGQWLPIQFQSIGGDKHHRTIKASFAPIEKAIQSIYIYNTCLIEEVVGHSNVITAHINDKMRGFRMDKKRVFIDVEY